MLEPTPQERLALIVIALLIAGGAVARHVLWRADRAAGLEFSSEAADTLDPASGQALLGVVEGEISEAKRRSQPLSSGEKIDPNTASAVELDRLPGIGPSLAERIVTHRRTNGRFRSLADLGEVSGIGDVLLRRITPHVNLVDRSTGSTRPSARAGVSINRSSAAELESLSGVGPALAERIVAYREEHGPFRRWEDLENVSGIGPGLRGRLQTAARLEP